MSAFLVEVVAVSSVINHPQADRLDIANINDYQVVVARDQFKQGDLVSYLPEGSVVPEEFQEKLGVTGKLAGTKKNRIKAIRLRGVLSQGLIFPAEPSWVVGDNVADILGVTKYVPPIPVALAGEVYPLFENEVVSFDIENIKKYPNVIQEGEMVSMTEKLHGTFTMLGCVPQDQEDHDRAHKDGRMFCSSKGLMHQRLGLKHNEKNSNNAYMRSLEQSNAWNLVKTLSDRTNQVVVLLGETFGQGIQDLSYGGQTPTFRAFRLYINKNPQNDDVLENVLKEFDVKRVPVLYKGPFNRTILQELTNGKETLSGNALHIREGVVVVPLVERYDAVLGQVILKSVSEDYLLRKNATEYN